MGRGLIFVALRLPTTKVFHRSPSNYPTTLMKRVSEIQRQIARTDEKKSVITQKYYLYAAAIRGTRIP